MYVSTCGAYLGEASGGGAVGEDLCGREPLSGDGHGIRQAT